MRRITARLLDTGPVLVLALIAGAGSFTHIRDTASEHGQTGWMSWAIAICIDLTCVMAARERQRDKKTHRTRRGPISWPVLVLTGGIVLSLAANLAQATPTVWGWITAATPAGAFLVAVSMLERRATTTGTDTPQDVPQTSSPSAQPSSTVPAESRDVPVRHQTRRSWTTPAASLTSTTPSTVNRSPPTPSAPAWASPNSSPPTCSRVVSLDPSTVRVFKAHRARQDEERLRLGESWKGGGAYVFTTGWGDPLFPDTPSSLMPKLIETHNKQNPRAQLPHARLHDLRHIHATTLLLAGVPVHVLAARLGHADLAITLRIYAHVIHEQAATAADVFAKAVTE
ncbi:DUF2637 domain-containing protein [Actinomadura sp. ATCC 31491]|uniref:DUF2637 domain-containing protein n=1 Tax=Actinomadura luzonensis TaxID=2805427 RepID=A0ABT0FRU7_9ACTN|nr:DUF2637 domain-containing protein [Actinomadura luzonensis]MCK2214994.1 DUF2637 domain-containing protein [Actinomadura luzonensis]